MSKWRFGGLLYSGYHKTKCKVKVLARRAFH